MGPDPLEIAAKALRHRDRSRHEIDRRLAQAGIAEEQVADALDTLERVGYLDDGRFARARAEALARRGYGDAWIRHDLSGEGVAAEVLAEAIGALEPEAERAAALVERLGRTRKVGAQLARKGFGEDSLESALGTDVAE